VVKIQSTNIRKEPKFYAGSLSTIKAGDSVELIETQNDWIKVRTTAGVIGWIHSSAVEQQKFKLSSLDKSLKTQASASEVALAGKGFNKQVEESYRQKNQEISFVYVEKMLAIRIPSAVIEDFLKTGRLGEFRRPK
ncbi:MAG: SH3 domain-containing protein, partial [Candidatus Aminicenantes bacterium]|nr:SH3 domain-containing protein [Candidatus Aminicenantes bacterium]